MKMQKWRGCSSPRTFVARRADFACWGILAVLPLLGPAFLIGARAAVPHPSSTQGSWAAAQVLESKLRVLSGADSKASNSFKPIVITEDEANSYLKYHAQEFFPPGVHDPAIRILPERVIGAADVDFNEFSQAYSNPGDWGPKVLAIMFKGRQRVSAAGKLESRAGQCKVKIESVAVGSMTVPDWLVDFVLENYLQPRYQFDLSKPFALPDHVTHIELASRRSHLLPQSPLRLAKAPDSSSWWRFRPAMVRDALPGVELPGELPGVIRSSFARL